MSKENVQAVTGFRVVSYGVRRVKEDERIKIVLEANIDDVLAGDLDLGDVQKALLEHRVSDTDVGLSLIVE